MPLIFTLFRMGSSPLARGLRIQGDHAGQRVRIIPARAGFTCWLLPALFSGLDHPRSRGVYRQPTKAVASSDGSSPLARGLRGLTRNPAVQSRIIPARAGFTSLLELDTIAHEDHPRSRGVYFRRLRGRVSGGGSSPLARGLLIEIISGEKPALDHPRSRGVYYFVCFESVRGPVDHPRSRGVYVIFLSAGPVSTGSSPLARGLPFQRVPRGDDYGIIPARAGFTECFFGDFLRPGDHPRSRGVYYRQYILRRGVKGSSPLARGLQASLPG